MSDVIPSLTPSYVLRAPANIQTYNYGNIIKTISPSINCPKLIYDVVMSDGSAIDSTTFTFNAAQATLTTVTSYVSKVGAYNMKLTATYGANYPTG